MTKHYRSIPLFLLLGIPGVTACLERIDTGAAKGNLGAPTAGTGGAASTGAGGSNTPRGGGGTSTTPRGGGGSGQQGGGGSSTTAQGGGGSVGTGGTAMPMPDAEPPPPPEDETPAIITTRPVVIYTQPDADLTESDDPCEATTMHTLVIFRRHCAQCHGGGPGQTQGVPPFTHVLDLDILPTLRSASTPDPLAPPENQIPGRDTFEGMRFVAPGDPAHSRIYLRIAGGEMPPDLLTVGAKHPPSDDQSRPTASDLSVIHQWISHCVAEPDEGGGEGDGGAPEDDGGGGPSDDGGGGPSDDGGAEPALRR